MDFVKGRSHSGGGRKDDRGERRPSGPGRWAKPSGERRQPRFGEKSARPSSEFAVVKTAKSSPPWEKKPSFATQNKRRFDPRRKKDSFFGPRLEPKIERTEQTGELKIVTSPRAHSAPKVISTPRPTPSPKALRTVEPRKSIIAATVVPVTSQEEAGSFADFSFPENIERALEEMSFTTPTPIQAKAIPVAMAGHDIVGCAQTGTGKTAAFSLPMIMRLLENEDETALILAPTRELALQIVEMLRKLANHARDLRVALIIGGTSYIEQGKALSRKPRIIVATPGRLVDHLQRKTVNLSKVSFLVLDEADRMLDMGFAPQLDKIMHFVPKDRQTLLFSATFAPPIRKMAAKFLRNPQEISIGAISQPAAGVEQQILETTQQKKVDTLLNELNNREGTILIFTATKHRTDKLTRTLEDYGHSVTRIHGGRSMGQRKLAIKGFREQHFRILVATDIAARGLDISHVAHVINYDLPRDPEDYIHRIGRTARAGQKGQALSFITKEERGQWQQITRLLPKDMSPRL